jgi:rhamnosyltransferase
VVVDNGSSPEVLGPVRHACLETDSQLIEIGTNLGIAAALNVGVRWAKARGFRWVALFDQDSEMTEGFIAIMLGEYEQHPRQEKVAVVTPKHLERESGLWRKPAFAKDGSPMVAITSGSLIPAHIFDECGYFEEDLIIDRVDDEYCLRVRSFGYTIALCSRAFLTHSVGTPKMRSFLGLRQVITKNYGPRRYYYLSRNRVVIVKRYWRQYPRWSYDTLQGLARDTVVNFVVEDRRWKKLATTLRGIFDGLRGRMGKVVEL